MGNIFNFKHFSLDHSCCAMKVGTDAILLGAWMHVEKAANVLDIGAGTGIVSLIVAQRNNRAQVKALEIEPDCAAQAVSNFIRSPWANRLKCIEVDAKCWNSTDKFDLIVSNPPYFVDSLKAKGAARSLARHTDSLSLRHLFDIWDNMGTDNSTMALILPYSYLEEVEAVCAELGCYIWRKMEVRPKAKAEPNRVLLQLSRSNRLKELDELAIHHTDGYTDAYKQLTIDLYLGL